MGDWGGDVAKARGLEVRRQLYENATEQRDHDDIAPDFGSLADEVFFGGIWSRPGLDLPTRAMIVVAADLGMGHFDNAQSHMACARRVGVTQEQMVELAYQLIPYAGLPAADRALRMIREVYEF